VPLLGLETPFEYESLGMSSRVGETGLVLLVPEADGAVSPWRQTHDPSAAEGMPAHITLLYPFVMEEEISDEVLGQLALICANAPVVELSFTEFGRFPGVLWLKPNTTLCNQLIRKIRDRWPECLPYGRDDLEVIPHLTVTDGADDDVAARACADVAQSLPLQAKVSKVTLVVFNGQAWVRRHEFALGSRTNQELDVPDR
jgi:2'-5' RNA ligase